MNIDRIRKIISARYQITGQLPITEQLPSNVIRAEWVCKQRPLGVYYFDCSNKVAESDFNLSKYQDNLLSKDYYTHHGSIRWNFYLYFICENKAYSRLFASNKIRDIEIDRTYARKFVVTEDELEKHIVRSMSWDDAEKELPQDISTIWIDKLRENDLDGIYDKNQPYRKVVNRYISGTPIKEDHSNDRIKLRPKKESALKSIDSLKLKNYRHFETEEVFKFGSCNLIYGANGSGKTSLLEAIEGWVCGKTNRNLKQEVLLNTVGIKFDGAKGFVWNMPGGTKLYQDRDLSWYGNHSKYGNNLYSSFNRFNFYDTDAAVSLVKNTTDKSLDIASIFSSLVV